MPTRKIILNTDKLQPLKPTRIIPNIDKGRPLKFDGVFRIVSWNTEGEHQFCHKGNEHIADFIIKEVKGYNANVICLQELMGLSFDLLEKRLKNINKSWNCFFDWKEISKGQDHSQYWPYVIGLAICVLGRGSNFKWNYFTKENGKEWRDYARRYMQIDYKGKRITCVHTSSYWKKLHVTELHKKVTSGISAGDFNHQWPDKRYPSMWSYDPGWNQTDLSREWTHPAGGKNLKIDHILAIETPWKVDGEARDLKEGGSDHRLILGSIEFLKRATKPSVKKPVTKKPIPIKPIRRISPKKTAIKKKTTKKSATKKKDPKRKVARKILRRITR